MHESRNAHRNVTAMSTLLLHFGNRSYLFSPDERSCYIFSTRNNCCEFLASYGVTFKVLSNHLSSISFILAKLLKQGRGLIGVVAFLTQKCILTLKLVVLNILFASHRIILNTYSPVCWHKIPLKSAN